jgi:hypothetical protein
MTCDLPGGGCAGRAGETSKPHRIVITVYKTPTMPRVRHASETKTERERPSDARNRAATPGGEFE